MRFNYIFEQQKAVARDLKNPPCNDLPIIVLRYEWPGPLGIPSALASP